MRIDIIIESDKTAAEFTRLGRIAEEYGIGAIWEANNANGRDPFVNFTPLAMETKRILRLSWSVQSIKLIGFCG